MLLMISTCYNLEDISVFVETVNLTPVYSGWLAFTSLFASTVLIMANAKTAPSVFQSGQRKIVNK